MQDFKSFSYFEVFHKRTTKGKFWKLFAANAFRNLKTTNKIWSENMRRLSKRQQVYI